MHLQICLSTGGKVEISSGDISVSQPVQRVHQAYDDGAYIMCRPFVSYVCCCLFHHSITYVCFQAPAARILAAACHPPPSCADDSARACRVLFSTQPLQSDKYNDPCACGGGAATARPAGYGLGSLRGGAGMQPTAADRPEPPLLPCAHCCIDLITQTAFACV